MSPTLEDGWKAFSADLIKQPEYLPEKFASFRQAYKNGASFILAKALVRGASAIPRDEVAMMQLAHPVAAYCMRLHPEWGKLHSDCVIAGAFAIWTLVLSQAPKVLESEIEAFVV